MVEPKVCWIGRVVDVNGSSVTLFEINPDARWSRRPTVCRLSEITRVDFGGDYEDARHLVGGNPPVAGSPS